MLSSVEVGMTDYRYVRVEQSDNIATVSLHRPDHRNALNEAVMTELTDIAYHLRQDSGLRAVILTGTDRFFSAGADLAMIQQTYDASGTFDVAALRQNVRLGPDMCRAWEDIEAITIAAIEGYCVGGACSLALACDFRLAGSSAMMRLPEVPLGMNMSWQTLPRLTTLIGPSRAKQFAIFGQKTDSQTLLDWGLVDQLCEDGDVLEVARSWAHQLAALPPLPVRMTKEAINATANVNHHATSVMDRDQFLLTLITKIMSPEDRSN